MSMRKTACCINRYSFKANPDHRLDLIRFIEGQNDLVGLASLAWKASVCRLGSLTLVKGFILDERFMCHHINLWNSCNLTEYEHRIWLGRYVTSAAHLVPRFPTSWMCPFYTYILLPVSKTLYSDLVLSLYSYAHYIFIYPFPFFISDISQKSLAQVRRDGCCTCGFGHSDTSMPHLCY